MAAITTPIPAQTPQMRPLNILRDLPGVAELVEKCFADTIDPEGRRYLQQMRRAGQDNAFLRWASRTVETASMPLSGYVWDPKAQEKGEDAPLKQADHAPDALRYGVRSYRTVWRRWMQLPPIEEEAA